MKIILAIMVALSLSACSGIKALVVDKAPVEIKQYHPPLPAPVYPTPPRFKVLTYETTTVLNKEVETGDKLPYSYFAMTEQDYLTMAAHIQDFIRWAEQMRAILRYYRADQTVQPDAPPNGEDEKPIE